MFYDSMIAKLCVYDQNSRADAIERMKLALGQFIISGISSNISFLEAIIGNKRFVENDINTNFINEEYPDGFSGVTLTSETVEAFIACSMHVFMEEQKRKLNIQGQIIDQSSSINTRWVVKIDDMSFLALIKEVEDGYNIRQGSNKIYTRAKYKLHNKLYTATLNGRKINVQVKKNKSSYLLTNAGVTGKVSIRSIRVSELEEMVYREAKEDFQDQITAPINGIITRVSVSVGDKISKGQELFVISAMKMENTILSEQNAVVSGVCVKDGSVVSAGEVLIEFSEL
jgi:propionyl-CoA carboxylase alpha chain